MRGQGRTKEKDHRHVRIYHWVMSSPAWRDLNPVERCAYIEIASRYAGPGSNNGRIPFSMKEMAEALNVSKTTAQRAFHELQLHGFIVLTKQGGFNMKMRHASEWRLTEFKDDVTGQMATKEFARWQKSKGGSSSVPQRVSSRNRTGT